MFMEVLRKVEIAKDWMPDTEAKYTARSCPILRPSLTASTSCPGPFRAESWCYTTSCGWIGRKNTWWLM